MALVATNLISEKIVEGKARLIVKSDVQAIATKSRLLEVNAVEAMLAEGWQETSRLIEHGANESAAYRLVGRLSSRVLLFMTKKQKDGPEQLHYNRLSDINRKCREELNTISSIGTDAATSASAQS